MIPKRIVSFLPSATELLYELEEQDKIFGVTHECRYPQEASLKPKIINTVINSEKLSSKEINSTTCKLLNEGKDIFVLNEANLKKANPDMIISQETCEVCAAYTNQVNNAVKILDTKPIVYSMDPHNMDEIIESVTKMGEILNCKEKAGQITNLLEKRIRHIQNNKGLKKPKVVAIEWIEPFFTAGHWIPEMIEIAGGTNMISHPGEHSRRLDFKEIEEANPDIIILMPCGFDIQRTISEYNETLKNNNRWRTLNAFKTGQIYAVDANSFFSKPSIRTIDGTEILAKIIHPKEFVNVKIPEKAFAHIGNN
ncbi:cobalamin-binding protein [Nitrosopumilus sp.]|uniref:cobalamin-binding protein n=1 Tax=Nitrosopumilus sp. TaxID=2024843 RepID=UPI00247D268E|nr:cobalamin-binding protein [Nitrosopumilus sp.]MCV0430257.1 cobalamin-binding protein [Nitrosopumilus sp.]